MMADHVRHLGDGEPHVDDILATLGRGPAKGHGAAAMTQPPTEDAEELRQQIEALEERTSRLGAAVLHVSDKPP